MDGIFLHRETEPCWTVINDFRQVIGSEVFENADRYGPVVSLTWQSQSIKRSGNMISIGIHCLCQSLADVICPFLPKHMDGNARYDWHICPFSVVWLFVDLP